MIKLTGKKIIEVQDWDEIVKSTYGRIYDFQQQNGCVDRGLYPILVEEETPEDEFAGRDEIPEVVNGEVMGVSFNAWLARDPKQPIQNQKYDWELSLFWERNFYPDVNVVAHDLYKKGLIELGSYDILIDW